MDREPTETHVQNWSLRLHTDPTWTELLIRLGEGLAWLCCEPTLRCVDGSPLSSTV